MKKLPLGNNIKRLRLERQMKQHHLARHLHVSVQAISKWENGRTYPDVVLLPALADLFSVTLDELFGRDTGT